MSTNASQNMPENSDNLRYLKSQNCDITQKVEAPIRFRNLANQAYIYISFFFFFFGMADIPDIFWSKR